jgi:methionyl-tRNA formyltransferase
MAIVNGETKTGIAIMQTDIGIDTGDVWANEEIDIFPDETAGELVQRLGMLGAPLLVKTLTDIEHGNIQRKSQDHSIATYYPMLKKENGKIDLNKSAQEIVNFVRGMNPWPGAWMDSKYGMLKVHKASVSPDGVSFDIVQPEGKRPMTWKEFMNGRKD